MGAQTRKRKRGLGLMTWKEENVETGFFFQMACTLDLLQRVTGKKTLASNYTLFI